MGDTKERLGIEIDVTFGKDLQSKLNELVNTLNQAFKVEGLQKMYDQFSKLGGATGKVTSGLKGSKADIETFAAATGILASEIEKVDKATGSNSNFNRWSKGLTEYAKGADAGAVAAKSFADAQNKVDAALATKESKIASLTSRYQELTTKAAAYTKETGKEAVSGAALSKAGDIFGSLSTSTSAGTLTRFDTLLASIKAKITAATNELATAEKARVASEVNTNTVKMRDADARKAINAQLVKEDAALATKEARLSSLASKYADLAAKAAAYTKATGKEGVSSSELSRLNNLVVSVNTGTSEASIKRVNTQLDAMQHKLKLAAAEAKNSGGAFSFLGDSIGKMAARLTEFYGIRAVLFAAGNQTREAVTATIDLNQAVHDIAAISGAPREAMQGISDSIMSIATNSRYSAKEVAGLMEVLAQAGVASRDLPTTSATVGMFATGAGATPEQAADVFTTALNVFDIKAEQGSKVANVLTAALNNSKLAVGGLATAFNYLGPQAAQLGMSLEDTVGIISTMSQAGIKASTIGTGVSQLLKELTVPKARFKNLLDAYGISPEEVNPKLHSFADIVDKLKEKGVQTEHLFQALESRVGRSVVAAVNLGGDAFRTMTASVTGTNAAVVAYDKAMEGSRARINVMKQEFVSLFVGVGTQSSAIFGGITDAITNVIRGLQQVPAIVSQITAAVVALAVVIKGISMLSLTGTVITAVLAVGTALAWAFGHDFDKQTQRVKQMSKNLSEVAETTQAVKDVTEKAKIEAEANNKALSAYDKLVKAGKSTVNAATEAGNTHIKMTAETKKSMYELREAHGEYFKGIDIEKLKYSELLGILKKVNEERFGSNESATSQYNSIAMDRNDDKYRLAVERRNLKSGNYEDTSAPLERSIAEREKRIAKAEANLKELRPKITGKVATADGLLYDIPTEKGADKKVVPPLPKATTGATPEEKHDKQLAVKKLDDAILLLKAEIANKESQLKASKLEFTETKALEDYKESAKEIENLKEKLAIKEKILEANKGAAAEVNGTVKLDSKLNPVGIVPNFKQGYTVPEAEDAVARKQEILSIDKDTIHRNADNARTAIAQTKLKTVPEKDTTTYQEKQEGMRISDEVAALNLRKETARTAAEVREIDDQIAAAQVASATKLRKIYEEQVELITKKGKAAYSNEEEYQTALQGSIDRVTELTRKEDELTASMNRQKGANIWDSFSKGFNQASIALGDLKSNMESLGNSIGSTMFSGVQDTLNSTLNVWTKPETEQVKSLREDIAKLNAQKAEIEGNIASSGAAVTPEQATALSNQKVQLAGINTELAKQSQLLGQQTNAWTAFKNGLSKLVGQIADAVQQMVVKLMVLYMWQKLVGFATSSAFQATSIDGGTQFSNGIEFNDGAVTQSIYGSMAGYAEGGQVPLNMGIAGKDSISALLMPGEFVIKKSVVDAVGVDRLTALNAKRFADGGLVGASDNYGKSVGKSTGNTEANLTIINVVDPSSIPKTTGQEILNVISYEAAQRGPTFRHLKASLQG